MITVWKQQVPLAGVEQDFEMPRGAKVLHVAEQFSTPCIWFEVDDHAPKEVLTVYIVGTGHEVPSGQDADLTHIGSVMTGMGTFVWHLYMPSQQVIRP